MVDAPLSRTAKEAEAGTLATFVGGAPETVARVLPVIRCYADTIIETGPLGSAHTMKLVNNFIAIATSAVVCEGIAAAMTLGLDMAKFKQVVETGGADSTMFQRCIHWATDGDDSHFKATISTGLKDLRYYLQLIENDRTGTTLADAASELYANAASLGHERQFIPVLSSILATFADGKTRELPKR